jgi:hypothetical protein
MSVDYWAETIRLSKRSHEACGALTEFLELNPRPTGLALAEYDKLALAYSAAFAEWIQFCSDNVSAR